VIARGPFGIALILFVIVSLLEPKT
jgi:hypothetical protein